MALGARAPGGRRARPAHRLRDLRVRGVAAAPGVGVRHLGRGCRAPRRPRLAHVAHTRVSPARLYGSECRRVSIGLVVLRSSAHVVVSCLRAVAAARGTTVVLSIHRPSTRLLSAMDCLLLLSRGTVLHHGSLASLDAALLSGSPMAPLRVLPRPTVNPMRAAASNVRDPTRDGAVEAHIQHPMRPLWLCRRTLGLRPTRLVLPSAREPVALAPRGCMQPRRRAPGCCCASCGAPSPCRDTWRREGCFVLLQVLVSYAEN